MTPDDQRSDPGRDSLLAILAGYCVLMAVLAAVMWVLWG